VGIDLSERLSTSWPRLQETWGKKKQNDSRLPGRQGL